MAGRVMVSNGPCWLKLCWLVGISQHGPFLPTNLDASGCMAAWLTLVILMGDQIVRDVGDGQEFVEWGAT